MRCEFRAPLVAGGAAHHLFDAMLAIANTRDANGDYRFIDLLAHVAPGTSLRHIGKLINRPKCQVPPGYKRAS